MATKDELKKAAEPIVKWFEEHQPSGEECFYQVDHIILELPELGIACIKLAELLGYKFKED